jgi:DHA2 family multidrug resistance protein
MTSGFTPVFNQVLSLLQDLGLSDLGAKAAVSRNMVGQAYLLASVDMFTVSAWLCVLGIVLVWLCHRAQPHVSQPAVD